MTIQLQNIGLTRAGRTLFENFNLTIRKGEHWLIQGDNGSGKSILLQLIAGSITPTTGMVHYDFITDGDWDSLYRQRREKIHLVATQWLGSFLHGADLFYQQRYYAMDDSMLPLVADVFGDDRDGLRSLQLSERFNIDALLQLPVTRLSNGQVKKVVILRQLVRSIPAFLLLDYPFDGLDPESRQELSAFLDDLARRFSIQLVIVDHGHAVPSVINRRLQLRNFRIHEIDDHYAPPDEQSASPATPGPQQSRAGNAVVEMQDLTIAYGEKKIIENLNWRIRAGERWALTGRNGSGKTTLFSLIYADHPMAYSQKVFLFGRRRGTGESIWDIKKRINYFGPEQIHFLDGNSLLLSAREYIGRAGHKDPSRLDDLVGFFHAGGYIDLPMRFLSSGQLQLILLINMFLDDKELLLLDEPFQFLDPDNHARVTAYLNRYLNQEITLVLITHDEKDVARWTQLRMRL